MANGNTRGQKGRGVACLCVTCRNVFYATRRDAKTCGVKCRVAYHRALANERFNTILDRERLEEQQARLEALFS